VSTDNPQPTAAAAAAAIPLTAAVPGSVTHDSMTALRRRLTEYRTLYSKPPASSDA